MRKMRARKRGIVTRLKNGVPTLIFVPLTASAMSGKIVPRKTVKATATRRRLFKRNADSREMSESSSPWALSFSPRQARREREKRRTTPMNERKKIPMEDCVNEWTEPIIPERVRNVPNWVREKVSTIRVRFQTRSIRRRSWIMTEWRKAVPVSQGMKAAFSTGSHAQ
jgi:hypothetical protein